METAEEMLRKEFWFGDCPDSMWEDDIPGLVALMKEYAKQCAIKALKDAAENARMRVDSIFGHEVINVDSFCDQDGDTISIDKESITKTEIKLP